MKRYFSCLCIVLIGFTTHLHSQRYSKSQFTLFSYDITVDDKIKSELSSFENLIEYNPEKQQDRITGMLTHTLYEMTSKILSDTLNVFVLPINSLGDKAKYNDYGYPDITIQKAIKLADTKYYFKINASIKNQQFDETGKKVSENVFKPEVTIKLEVFNRNGYLPIQSTSGSSAATRPITISKNFITGMRFVEETDNGEKMERLRDIYKRAILEAVVKLKYKNPK